MQRNKGISLIVLVITIIVIIILAGAVILSLSKNNPISSASEAKFKMSLDSYSSEVSMSISKKYMLDPTLNITKLTATTWDGNLSITDNTVKEYIPSITAADGTKYIIVEGKLVYIGDNSNEIDWIANSKTIQIMSKFNYTGSVQTFTAPIAGTYTLEVWGASGGGDTNQILGSHKGLGGYSKGSVSLTLGQSIYIYVGGQGTAATNDTGTGGGWNGGGHGGHGGDFGAGWYGFGGGGATDIRTTNGLWNDSISLASRIIVAGGGGGADNLGGIPGGGDDGTGGSGGGLSGGDARIDGVFSIGTGATQIVGTLGKGQDVTTATDTGGGGSGYRGGFVTNNCNGGGGGGSGYIAGVTSGTTQNGFNDGNGYVKITL